MFPLDKDMLQTEHHIISKERFQDARPLTHGSPSLGHSVLEYKLILNCSEANIRYQTVRRWSYVRLKVTSLRVSVTVLIHEFLSASGRMWISLSTP